MSSDIQLFLQQLVNGLAIGMVYALIALGYTMVYGVIQLINFAHGEIFMVGGYLALTAIWIMASIFSGAPVWFVLPSLFFFSMLGSAALGGVVEKTAYKPLRGSPKLTALITSIGVSFFLQNAVMLIYGAREQNVPEILPPLRVELGAVSLSLVQCVLMTVSLALMVFLTWFVRRTKLGKAMRACAENPEAAHLVGISTDRIIRLTFLIGSALAAVAGALFALNYGSINFHDGYLAGLKAFTAAVLGGIGSIPGAMLGGVLLGVCEGLGAAYLSSSWKDVIAFLILVVVLLCKPSGLLGENLPEKV
ncbi:MAG: branched-chain amino acid ABC transporter permease [Candidatus Omnitrophica bacterium]|nr:branched-chain amino acid ABC transporter permease [Candidatus Omnitrophota bacterium]